MVRWRLGLWEKVAWHWGSLTKLTGRHGMDASESPKSQCLSPTEVLAIGSFDIRAPGLTTLVRDLRDK